VELDRPDTVGDAIADADLVVDLVPHPGLVPERAVLREGGVLIDVSARSAAASRGLRQETPDPRGVVVLNAGRTPGVSTLVAADLLAADPDADQVEIAFSFSASGMSGRAGGESAHRHLIAARRHRTAVIPFPPPIGARRCLAYAESEEGWLGGLAQGRTVITYARFAPRALNGALLALNRLGLMSRLPRAAFVRTHKAAPTEATAEPVTEWVAVRRRGMRLAATTIEGEGGYRMTAAATVVLADALLDAHGAPVPEPGCFDPQELFTLEQLEAGLRQAGVRVVRHPAASLR
jgi:hypothetical protein